MKEKSEDHSASSFSDFLMDQATGPFYSLLGPFYSLLGPKNPLSTNRDPSKTDGLAYYFGPKLANQTDGSLILWPKPKTQTK